MWYSLDFDVFEQDFSDATPKLIKSDAFFINVSTGLIVNGAYYCHLIDASFDSLHAVSYSQIPLPQLQQTWSAIFQNAQAEAPDIICANLCRDFFYPSLPSSNKRPALQKDITSSTPFWPTSTDNQLRSCAPSYCYPSNDLSAPRSSFS